MQPRIREHKDGKDGPLVSCSGQDVTHQTSPPSMPQGTPNILPILVNGGEILTSCQKCHLLHFIFQSPKKCQNSTIMKTRM